VTTLPTPQNGRHDFGAETRAYLAYVSGCREAGVVPADPPEWRSWQRYQPLGGGWVWPEDLPEVPEEAEEVLTGWERVDLGPVLAGEIVTVEPSMLKRTDGVALLYPGKAHAFNGEPESLKSWVVQVGAAEVLLDGGVVMYLDFEDGPEGVAERMRALGVPVDALVERFHYHRLDQPLTLEARAVIYGEIEAAGATLGVIDGVTEAMALCGLDPYGNSDVAKFWAALVRPVVKTGAACALIDHVIKDREGRGRWAIGAQHKMAAVDGAAFMVECTKPFGRGRDGVTRITITKDRPGHLRRHAVGGVMAELYLRSDPDGGVFADLRPPVSTDEWRPTALMERVSKYVEANPGVSKNTVVGSLKGSRTHLTVALQWLVTDGFIGVEEGPRRTHQLTSLKPFREEAPRDETRDVIG